ncbi:MAG: phosphoribosylaminoimidazolesuccinocarboxamide synthase [Clostridiales bacterium]|nr:phosphoribosylaminoimidazolesuccinocarboxamide synthase [Clostridiales bacterium]
MELIYQGKTKDVFVLGNKDYLLKYKDDATGKDGAFDPGENSVGLSIEGLGYANLKLSQYLFKELIKNGVPTHFIKADLDEKSMTVKPARLFGKGLEFICRLRAYGSYLKRYSGYVKESQPLDYFIEVTLKDDEKGDPVISKPSLIMLQVMTKEEYRQCKKLTRKCTKIIKACLNRLGLELYDIKFEFGIVDGKVAVIDELSGGNMRVFKDGKSVMPIELSEIVTNEGKVTDKAK